MSNPLKEETQEKIVQRTRNQQLTLTLYDSTSIKT